MEALKKNHLKFISLKQAKKIVLILVFVLFFDFLLFPTPVLASQMLELTEIEGYAMGNQSGFINRLPENPDSDVKLVKQVVITAYNSEPGQTDNSPCITANNYNVCDSLIEDTIAANFLPFGAKVRIPDLYGDRVFIVRDRMNQRHSQRVDIWMMERPDAINFGVQIARIEVLR